MKFNLWSETDNKIFKNLKPELGLRNWDVLSEEEKEKIWQYLRHDFFDKLSHKFFGEDEEIKRKKQLRIFLSIIKLNERYKVNSFAKQFLEEKNLTSACSDFYNIFKNENGDVVLDLLSFYCKELIEEQKDIPAWRCPNREKEEKEEQFKERVKEWKWSDFDKFSKYFNEVFTDFGINVYLARQGFIPRQDEKITKEIYEPVLKFLSNKKWNEANRLLSDSFNEFRKNTPQGYSNCVTNVISALQAFLQIIVNGKTGKGDIIDLIMEAQKKKMIPDDSFSSIIFRNMESVFAKERKETGIAHPKKEYATEKNARLILNLIMIFFQHCIQK